MPIVLRWCGVDGVGTVLEPRWRRRSARQASSKTRRRGRGLDLHRPMPATVGRSARRAARCTASVAHGDSIARASRSPRAPERQSTPAPPTARAVAGPTDGEHGGRPHRRWRRRRARISRMVVDSSARPLTASRVTSGGGLVVAQAEVARVAEAAVAGPLAELELGHQLGAQPARARAGSRRGAGAGRTGSRRWRGRRTARRAAASSASLKPVPTRPAKRERPVAGRVVVADEQRADAPGAVALARAATRRRPSPGGAAPSPSATSACACPARSGSRAAWRRRPRGPRSVAAASRAGPSSCSGEHAPARARARAPGRAAGAGRRAAGRMRSWPSRWRRSKTT